MRPKVQRRPLFRRVLPAGMIACVWLLVSAGPPEAAVVSGQITMLDKGDTTAHDVGQAVIWLAAPNSIPVAPVQAEIGTAEKEFSPHVLVVPIGSAVDFPNHDPFNHNVFSLSEENSFDLGLYGRGATRSTRFRRPGVVRIFCNVHAQMSALVVVRDGPYFTQPSTDGSFVLPSVTPGRYQLHVWHERTPEVTREVQVPGVGLANLAIELDARGYRFKSHLNKHGQPYSQEGRRY